MTPKDSRVNLRMKHKGNIVPQQKLHGSTAYGREKPYLNIYFKVISIYRTEIGYLGE
jgi:hypothetical protein